MGKFILIIEDDDVLSAVLTRALTRTGHQVTQAADAHGAMDHALTLPPDWVVLDLNLGGASGLRLIPRLLEANRDCRIVVLTGYASIATAVDAIKLGAVQYLRKPVDIETLLAAFGDSGAANATTSTADAAFTVMSIDRMEWEHIQRVLSQHDGNISATARALNMHRRTLQRKLAKRPASQ